MLNYNVHVNGTVKDDQSGFEVGFDVTVANGASIEGTGSALQGFVNVLRNQTIEKQQQEATESAK